MDREREKPDNVFDNDELDDALINADDTGMLKTQHDIAQEDLIGGEEEEPG
jgi:hypothetical protein